MPTRAGLSPYTQPYAPSSCWEPPPPPPPHRTPRTSAPSRAQLLPQALGDPRLQGPLQRAPAPGRVDTTGVAMEICPPPVGAAGRVHPHLALRSADQPDQRPLPRHLPAADAG